jgi:hypothetical protein
MQAPNTHANTSVETFFGRFNLTTVDSLF